MFSTTSPPDRSRTSATSRPIPASPTPSTPQPSPGVVAELVDEADVVFHLAAAVGVELIVDSPVRTIETNVHCTEIVLAAANKKKKPVFFASHERGLRQERRAALPGGRRPAARADDHRPLVVRLLEGDRRVPGARVPQGARPARRDRPAVQHGRAASDRAATGWSSPTSCARRSPASRSPCTETGASGAASATSRTSCARRRPHGHRGRRRGGVQHRQPRRR